MTASRKSRGSAIYRQPKMRQLQSILRNMGRVLVAFSGGVDSSFLLKAAADTLGPDVYAVIASSPTYPEREIRGARDLARSLKVGHEIIWTREMDDPEFTSNSPLRCYHCKKELMAKLKVIAEGRKIGAVIDGQNADDREDYRPGAKAAAELGVRSPLREAGLGKAEIRAFSRRLGLPTWDKPSLACLASRFPYHSAITLADLRRVSKAEDALARLGFRQVRVRHHGSVARIEVPPKDLRRIMCPEIRTRLSRALKKAGYAYAALDLDGYRTGSLNETLGLKNRRRD